MISTDLKRLKTFYDNKEALFMLLDKAGLLKGCDDETYLKHAFRANCGYPLNLDNPTTFNEKLQWLKLHDRKPEYSKMVDKYEVKNYVAEKIGEQYIIPSFGVWNHFNEINFELLPNHFVLKCTHDSGGMVICEDKNKLDIKAARKVIERSLKRNFYWKGREWPYRNVPPRIICEAYLKDFETEDSSKTDIKDYKFFCFNGVVKFFKIDFDRFIDHHANYYDVNGNLLPFGEEAFPPKPDKELIIPDNLNEMIELASKLAINTPFLRVDFYNISGKIFFGELTFYPASGLGRFTPPEYEERIGNLLELPS